MTRQIHTKSYMENHIVGELLHLTQEVKSFPNIYTNRPGRTERNPRDAAQPYTILIVDDQEEALLSTRLLLEMEGYQVITANGGHEALSVFQPGQIQLLIIDYFMPRMNGEELVHAIRAQDEDVQILLQTGYAGEKPPQNMLKALDIQGYHNKVDDPERLLLWIAVARKTTAHLQKVREAERREAEYRTQLSNLSARLLHIQEEEQERISRELHDHFGQLLTAIGLEIDLGQPSSSGALTSQRQHLHKAGQLVQEAITATRTLAATLRPAELKDLGLAAALEHYVNELAQRGDLHIDIELGLDDPELPLETATNIYRIVQEALNNVVRHAAATEVSVRVQHTSQRLILTVSDNGRGFDMEQMVSPQTLGIVGMHERARLIDGKLSIDSKQHHGTTVQLEVPIP